MPSARAAVGGLTTRGRCLLAAGLTLAAGAVSLGQRDLLRVAVLLLALPLAAAAAVARTRYRLSCSRRIEPARVEAGRPATVRLALDNVSRLPSGVLLMEDTLPYALGGRPRFVLDRVAPGAHREASYVVHPSLRGRYRIGPLTVHLADPFGLCELTRAFSGTDELLVRPVTSPLPRIRLAGDWAAGGEAASRSIAVHGADDAATREYRYGDDLRKVHWRSTARVGELMVRREEQPFRSSATVLLDGRSQAHRGEAPASSFEWAVSAVASIVVSLVRSGYAVQVMTETGLELCPPGVRAGEDPALDALATVTTSRTLSLAHAIGRLRSQRRDSVVVAVLGDLDAEEAHRLARLRHGAATCVGVLLEPDTWAPSPGRAAEQAHHRHEATADLLRGAGWRVLPVPHGTTLASVWPRAGREALDVRSLR